MRTEVSLIALAVAVSMAGCMEADSKKPADPRPVRTVTVEPKPIEDDRRAVGEIRPRYESDLASASPARS